MSLLLSDGSARTAHERSRQREALKAQIELLEDEWRSGMERDTLVLLDRACARLAALEEEDAAPCRVGTRCKLRIAP